MEKSTETKEEIRKRVLKLRASVGAKERSAAEQKIRERLFEASFYREAESLYCYVSFRDEADTSGIIENSLRMGKKVAVPRVAGKREMEFYFISGMNDLHPGAWDIPEPGEECAMAPRPDEHTLVLLPGVAFDRTGNRIGYGGGYYDAYLAGNTKCRKAATAFSLQCMEKIPSEEHDVRTEFIITEKELIRCLQDYPLTR